MNSKGNQHAITFMVFLLIIFSFYCTGSLNNADAFEIGIPDIPFLNFNFENSFESGNGERSSEENAEGKVSDIISSNSREAKDDDLSSNVDANVEEYMSDVESGLKTYDSLPFPSNAINNELYGQSDKEEEDKEVTDNDGLFGLDYDQGVSFTLNALPLIGDYSDFPSTFLDSSPATSEVGNEIPNQHIVILEEDDSEVSDFIDIISENTKFQGVELLQVYEEVLNGLAIKVPNERVIAAIEKLPMVDYVENDVMTQAFAQTVPSGVNRIDGDLSSAQSGNGNGNVNVDIAIIDSGIDPRHSDLNVYHQKSFVTSNSGFYSLFGTRTTTANDDNGHGTHVAGIAAAKDNTIGPVGVAPGAKLWAIKVLDSKGAGPISTVIKGIDYVTQYASQIEVANLSLGCECKSSALDTAISNSVNSGIVFVVAAGNAGKDANNFSPANNLNVITVSAIGDSNGKCGGDGQTTGYGNDDEFASFSNYGSVVDIAAPGAKIYSTYKGNTYATMSGTSMASPHVAGAAALYLVNNPDANPLTVKSTLLSQGSNANTTCDGNRYGYFTGDKDQSREPLLYVGNY